MEDVMMKDVVDIEEKILWLHFFLINLLTMNDAQLTGSPSIYHLIQF